MTTYRVNYRLTAPTGQKVKKFVRFRADNAVHAAQVWAYCMFPYLSAEAAKDGHGVRFQTLKRES